MMARVHQEALDALIGWFETLTPESVERIDEFYADDAQFKDPFNDVRGLPAITHIFRHMFRQVEAPRFHIDESYVDDARVMLLWRFSFTTRWPRRALVIEGVTRLVFDSGGRVVTHRDYWDLAGELYDCMPGLGCVVRGLQRLGRA